MECFKKIPGKTEKYGEISKIRMVYAYKCNYLLPDCDVDNLS